VPALHDSYVDASTALYLAARLPGSRRVAHIDDLRVHELVAASGARSRLVRALIGQLREQPDWPVLRSTIVEWCESGSTSSVPLRR
jgi:carbohydrate diacid regulator